MDANYLDYAPRVDFKCWQKNKDFPFTYCSYDILNNSFYIVEIQHKNKIKNESFAINTPFLYKLYYAISTTLSHESFFIYGILLFRFSYALAKSIDTSFALIIVAFLLKNKTIFIFFYLHTWIKYSS